MSIPCHEELLMVNPLDDQVAMPEVHGHRVKGQTVENRGNDGGACPGSACQCLAAAALPDTHSEVVSVEHLDKFGVYLLRKQWVMFELRSNGREIDAVHIIDKHHAVRIADIHEGYPVYGSIHPEFLIDNTIRILAEHGNR